MCGAVQRHVHQVSDCGKFNILCSKIDFKISTIIALKRNKDDSPAERAPANSKEFRLQISGILNDSTISKYDKSSFMSNLNIATPLLFQLT